MQPGNDVIVFAGAIVALSTAVMIAAWLSVPNYRVVGSAGSSEWRVDMQTSEVFQCSLVSDPGWPRC